MLRAAGLLFLYLLLMTSCSAIIGGGGDSQEYLQVRPTPVDFRPLGGGGSITVSFTNNTEELMRIEHLEVDNDALNIDQSSFELEAGQSTNRSLNLDFDAFEGRENTAELFVEIEGEENLDILIQLPFKRFKINLSDHPSNNYPVAISPDGEFALFYSDRGQGHDIFLADIEEETVERLTDDDYNNIPVGFGETSDFILFQSDRNGHDDIFRLDLNGEITPLLVNEYDDTPVTIYGEDQQILFEREGNGAWRYDMETDDEIELQEGPFSPVLYIEEHDFVLITGGYEDELAYKVPPEGGEADSLLTFEEDQDVTRFIPVDYNAEHDLILAYSDMDFRRAIYTIKPDGTELQTIVNSPRNDFPVKFSKDGTYVLFESNRLYNKDVFTVFRSGTGEEQISTSDYDDIPVDLGPDTEIILFQSDREQIEGNRYHQVFITNFD